MNTCYIKKSVEFKVRIEVTLDGDWAGKKSQWQEQVQVWRLWVPEQAYVCTLYLNKIGNENKHKQPGGGGAPL